jgi:hypothetical protein
MANGNAALGRGIAQQVCRWQREQLPPPEIRSLVPQDQERRNHTCWSVFDT